MTGPLSSASMVGEASGFLHVVRIDVAVDPVRAEYQVAFAPVGGRLRRRHLVCHGLDGLTSFLRQVRVPVLEIERAWRMLAQRQVCSIPRVALTPAQLEVFGL